MSDDIVSRLRNSCAHTCAKCDDENAYAVGVEAADEIERLRADRDRWRDIAYEYYLTDTDCSCHICDRYREAAGIDNETV
jgi:hypothetical protein